MFEEVQIVQKKKEFVDDTVELREKFLIFVGSQFFNFDLISHKWEIGDVYDSEDIRRIDPLAPPRNNFDIADNCSIAYLNRSVNWANKIPLIVTGG